MSADCVSADDASADYASANYASANYAAVGIHVLNNDFQDDITFTVFLAANIFAGTFTDYLYTFLSLYCYTDPTYHYYC